METTLTKNKNGYGYKYTDIAEIHRFLEENNITYVQKVERIDTEDYIFTKKCINGVYENEWLQGCRVVQATLTGIKNPAQEQGSALTYARRYSLLMAFGLATEDDDAASLTQKKDTNKKIDNNKISKEMENSLRELIKSQKINTEKVTNLLKSYNYSKLCDLDKSKIGEFTRKLEE